MQRLPLDQYAALLCKAVGDYDFPAVTCEFEPGGDRIVRTSCRGSMLIVERYVGRLLRSPNRSEAKDGLSNVLYWGWANTSLAGSKVKKFRNALSDDDPRLGQFTKLIQGGCVPTLREVKSVGLPQFGMSFTTKVLMFLDPSKYPVLDKKIACIVRDRDFLPLSNILARGGKHIPMTQHTIAAYARWARWCRGVAKAVSEATASPRRDLRAVDVERALFTLAGSTGDEEEAGKACVLLQGPEGWTFDG